MTSQQKRNRRRGNAMVELAISLPFLTILVGGVFEFGYTFFVYNSLRNSVQAGARFASIADYESGGSSFESQVKNVVVYGTPNPDGDDSPTVPGLTADKVVVAASQFDGIGIPRHVTVNISGYSVPSFWRSMTLEGKPEATYPYMGQFVSE